MKYNILWTGGWDSTYRMVELSRKEGIVEPFYVYGDGRKSENYEIRAMNKIIELLKDREETKAEILPIHFIEKKTIPANEEITNAYKAITKETKLGAQHEWLARLAFKYPGLELGTEAAPLEVSNILTTINKHGNLISDGKEDRYMLDPITSAGEGLLVLGNFEFPIIKKNGKEMLENIKEWDYEDVMKYVWVCHAPIFGKPCGFCHPCELKIETGMEFLLTKSALKRYNKRTQRPYIFSYKLLRKFSLTLEKSYPMILTK